MLRLENGEPVGVADLQAEIALLPKTIALRTDQIEAAISLLSGPAFSQLEAGSRLLFILLKPVQVDPAALEFKHFLECLIFDDHGRWLENPDFLFEQIIAKDLQDLAVVVEENGRFDEALKQKLKLAIRAMAERGGFTNIEGQ